MRDNRLVDFCAFPRLQKRETFTPQTKTCLWGPRHGAPIFVAVMLPDVGRSPRASRILAAAPAE
jgi:hypothetical protein